MDYRPLGNTGLNVSEIGFGCGNVGGLMIRGEHREQLEAVSRAMELGINYFDTAPPMATASRRPTLAECSRSCRQRSTSGPSSG